MKRYVYSVLSIPVFAVLYIYTGISVLICIILDFVDMPKASSLCIWTWANMIFLIMGRRIHIKGIENIKSEQDFLLLANHASLFDIMAIMAICPGVSWFGRDRLMKIPVFGYFLKTINYIPMKSSDLRNTKIMLSQLIQQSKANSIAIFPEGTRTIDGKIQNFKRGFIHVLKASELDVLPVTLKGLYELKPKNRFHINFGSKIELLIHKPIPRESLTTLSDQEIITTVKEVIESVY